LDLEPWRGVRRMVIPGSSRRSGDGHFEVSWFFEIVIVSGKVGAILRQDGCRHERETERARAYETKRWHTTPSAGSMPAKESERGCGEGGCRLDYGRTSRWT